MDRIEFFRRQLTRFSRLASECADPTIGAELRVIADEYRNMLRSDAQAHQAKLSAD